MDTDSFVLPVLGVIDETADACSVQLGLTPEAEGHFDYRPGQFLTLAVPSDETGLAARCYSLSSSPADDGPLTVTVKRTAEGYASNWICDNLKAGDTIRVLPPSGIFTPADLDHDLLLFAGGSGVTPIISITRTALARGAGKIVVFYANRDEKSVIFADEWARLSVEHPDRLVVVHWLETVQGLPTQDQLKAFAAHFSTYDAFCCGPAPFMKSVSLALRELEFPRARRHQEKFVSLGGNPFGDVEELQKAEATLADADDHEDGDAPSALVGPVRLEVELDGQHYEFDDYTGDKPILEFLEEKGVDAPFSCREGNCSACACMVLEGEVRMRHNEVLDATDLADGIRLACQSLPVTEKLRITYNG
ncbi:ferredoxin--NADP reductase [Nocardioides sp. Root151]|uniref:ferredoxin--NADP reductase n=1 Tax=Nocardioides sp. Root151 TaxID=1736475 RepID=UPI000702CBCF|nr:ferredoxin--NADP reductase [Nocardioides sp. Root151]KQZ70254.1 3-ketosteroid-9-alpha-hydroxylase [Nocardioides sp. Root151]